MELSNTFIRYFRSIKDPRRCNRNRRHELIDILVITILGTICGIETWSELYDFGCAKIEWLKTFLMLPNGIPSEDTFARVFSIINPKEFDRCFSNWIRSLSIDVENAVIAIDGKTLRGSQDKPKGNKGIHIVSAWTSKHKLMLAQVKTADKSNEIEAIPRLLKMIDIKNSIITIDAMGCQKKIATQILKQEADYILSLKSNQPNLLADVKSIFAGATSGEKKFKKMLHLRKVEKTKAHGRYERRTYTLLSARDFTEFHARWPGMNSIGMVETKRTVNHETKNSVRFFITTILYNKIDDFILGVRKHWDIENNLHWSLDVSFKEDLNRTRKLNAAENLATVRRITLNLLKQENTHKAGLIRKRKLAGWDHVYLMKVLTADQQVNENCKVVQNV